MAAGLLGNLIAATGSAAAAGLLQQLERRYPGLTLDNLRQGWLPVQERLLQDRISTLASRSDCIESASLSCAPGKLRVTLDTCEHRARHTTSADLSCTDFVLTNGERHACFRVDEDSCEIRGRDFLGRATSWMASVIMPLALKCRYTSPRFARIVSEATDGAAFLDWPDIRVDLAKVEPLSNIVDRPFIRDTIKNVSIFSPLSSLADHALFGKTLLDFATFGPLSVEEDYVKVKVEPMGMLAVCVNSFRV